MSGMPAEWEYIPPSTKPCTHCGGTGKTMTLAFVQSPNGERHALFGTNPARTAVVFAEAHARENLSPDGIALYYGERA